MDSCRESSISSPDYRVECSGQTKSAPLGLKLHTAWGPVEVHPQVFTVMSGYDMLILGKATSEMPGICPNAVLDRIARDKFGHSAES